MTSNKSLIYVFAPSNSMAVMNQKMIKIGISNLKNIGFEVIFSKHINKQHFYTAGTLLERIEDLNEGLNLPEVAIMMPVFGGYNSNQLLEYLDFNLIEQSKKLFIGYSDISVLLNAIYAKTGLKTIHGPSFASFCNPQIDPVVLDSFINIYSKVKNVIYSTPPFAASDLWYLKPNLGPRDTYTHPSWSSLIEGEATGIVIGGNLNAFTSLVGTSYIPDLNGKILLLEASLDEKPAKFDQQITHLRHANIFSKIKGLILGQFPKNSEFSTELIVEILERAVFPHRYPIIYNTSFSHVDPLLSLPIGRKIKLTAQGNNTAITVNLL